MRIVSMAIGIIVLIVGIWITVGHPKYQSTETAAKIGSVSVQTTQDKPIPQWAGIAGIVVGGVLLVGAFASKRRS